MSQNISSRHIKCSHESDRIEWFDENVLSEFIQTGAGIGIARKEIDELVRSLYDLMKPQFYIVGSNLVVLKST